MADPIRKLAAIMFTDIAGFTAMSSQDEEAALKLLDQQREILKPIVDIHKGDWLKEIGDGLLLSFPSSKEAVNCAIEIQHNLKDIENLNLRIGIHQGDILEKGGDIFGDDVNIASRMEPFAAVGGVAISHKVAGDISSSPEFKVKLIGEPKLKGVKQKVGIYCITSHDLPETDISKVSAKLEKDFNEPDHDNAEIYSSTQKSKIFLFITAALFLVFITLFFNNWFESEKTGMRSIAVLPLHNLSNDPEQDYFAAGLHEALLNELYKYRGLKIISRTSTMRYKNTEKSIPEIADELGVDAIIEGSVFRDGGRIRITAQLIDASSDLHLWSQDYDRDLKDVLSLLSTVARSIAGEINEKLIESHNLPIPVTNTIDPDVFDTYTRAIYELEKSTPLSLALAINLFQKVIETEPEFAPGHLGLAKSLGVLGLISTEWPNKYLELAKMSALTTLELDENSSRAFSSLGFYHAALQQFDSSAFFYEKAISLDPNNSEAYSAYAGTVLIRRGKYEKALQLSEIAVQLNPMYKIAHYRDAIIKYYYGGRFEEMLSAGKNIQNLHPQDIFYANTVIGLALLKLEKMTAADSLLSKGAYNPVSYKLYSGLIAAAKKDTVKALSIAVELAEFRDWLYNNSATPDPLPFWLSILILEPESAFQELDRWADGRNPENFAILYLDPSLKVLRDDERFEKILNKYRAQWANSN